MFPQYLNCNSACGPLAQAAKAAYKIAPEAEALARAAGADGFEGFSSVLDIHGFQATKGNIRIIAFRGTDSLRNWLTDADVSMVTVKTRKGDIRVHAGFLAALDSVFGQIECAKPEDTVWVTGHSLGGALARLFAVRCFIEGKEVPRVVTFGEPRSLDFVGANLVDEFVCRSVRVVHESDIVPRVPAWLPWHRYHHAGASLFFDCLGVAHWNWSTWKRIPLDLVDLAIHFKMNGLAGLAAPVQEHSIEQYAALNYVQTPGLTITKDG